MPERSSKNRPSDLNQLAPKLAEIAAEGPASTKNPAAVALGRLGGKKGGKARAAKLTPERRSEIAKKAASERWKERPKTT